MKLAVRITTSLEADNAVLVSVHLYLGSGGRAIAACKNSGKGYNKQSILHCSSAELWALVPASSPVS